MASESIYEIQEELFEKINEVKKVYEEFVDSHKNLETILKELSTDEGFKGLASEGYIEIFTILLKYQEDLIEKYPKIYQRTYDFCENLKDITNSKEYRGLVE